jgi:hypothetical protein
MMKKPIIMLAISMMLLVTVLPAIAGSTAAQTVTYQVSAINEISVSGNPGAMNVSTATAGSSPDEVTDATTTYAITTNGSSKKITAVINTAMPANVTLKINMTAPTGGTSAGDVILTNVAADAVTDISTLAESGKSITYKLSATPAAGVVPSASKTVTLTVADGA